MPETQPGNIQVQFLDMQETEPILSREKRVREGMVVD
jgi:hypothetical protein